MPDPLLGRGLQREEASVVLGNVLLGQTSSHQPLGSPLAPLTKERQGNCLHLSFYLPIHAVMKWFLSIRSDQLVVVVVKYHDKLTNLSIFDFLAKAGFVFTDGYFGQRQFIQIGCKVF